MTSRVRVASATVYVDAVNGNDSNDGATASTALKTLQRALDYAHGNFDVVPPWTWADIGNVGYRSNVTVQMAPAPSANPYRLPQPAFIDGASPAGPITLRGDPANPLAYNLYAENSLQGLTAQNGAHLICDGFTIRGNAYCTLINSLKLGSIAVKNVWFGPSEHGGVNAPLGAAGGSQLDIIGPITLIGAGFFSILTAIEDSRIVIAPNCPIRLDNVMDFGIMVNMGKASIWTQGSPPIWNGPGLAGSTGKKLAAFWGAFIGFDHTLIPGSFDPATDRDSLSTVL